MLTYFNRLSKIAAVTALTLGVTFAQEPAQKAFAQVTGAGSSAVTTLLKDNTSASGSGPVWDYVTSFGSNYKYFVTGSGTGRAAFVNGTTDFVYTDGLGSDFGAGAKVLNNTIVNSSNAPVVDPISGVPYVVVNEAILNVAFPYNVPGFDVVINGDTACKIVRGNATLGDPINWNQVQNSQTGRFGPNLPIRRVARGDVSGTTATVQGNGTGSGFVDKCNAAGFNIPSIIGLGTNGFNDGTNIPNRKPTDIIVNAASPTGNSPADPFGAAAALNDDSNATTTQVGSNPSFKGSYTFGIINAVKATPGAIGYVETADANFNGLYAALNDPRYTPGSGLGLAYDLDVPNGVSTAIIAVGPTYGIFRGNYSSSNKVNAAQNVCYGSIFSGYEGNQLPSVYPNRAQFNIDSSTFPYTFNTSTEQGFDTDNYGSYGAFGGGFDFGPCSRIGGAIAPNQTISATLAGNTLTFAPGAPRALPQVGDTVNITAADGTVVDGVINSLTGNTAGIYIWQSNSNNYTPLTTFTFTLAKTTAATVPTFDHIVIVIEENHNYSQIIGSSSAPYINSLSSQGALFTSSYGVTHPSEPNYLALFSGSTQGVTNDNCPLTFSGANLASQLSGIGSTFTGYSETMPSVGYTGCSYSSYYRKHNPWVNFSNLATSVNQPFTSFPTTFANLPTVSVVVPNQQDDMHDGTIQQGDTWLKNNIDGYAQWAKINNSLLIVTFDEDNDTTGRIATIFVGAHVKPGTYSEKINHYNILRTIEASYGLSGLNNASSLAPITDVWQ